MAQTFVPSESQPVEPDFLQSTAHAAHAVLRLVLAARYRKNLVVAIMGAATLLGTLYYVTATRRYEANAVLLVSQTGNDRLDTSMTNDESLRQNTMPTFENMIKSAKVLEGALKELATGDNVDLNKKSTECSVGSLREGLSVKSIRSTSILELNYRSKEPQSAVNVVRAIVQSYLNFMDSIQRGTVGEINRMLTKEREELSEKLARKQQELLDCRRLSADMGFRADGKTTHPMVQRAVYFNDALITVQKQRVEQEALLATIQTAVLNGENLGQYLMSVDNSAGREMLLKNLGLSSHDVATQGSLEQNLIASRAELQTVQQNLGPMHPEVVALTEKVRATEQFLASANDRIGQRLGELQKSQLGPWLIQMVQQKLDESRKKEEILKTAFEETRTEAINLSGQMAQIEMLERDVKRLGDMNDVLLNQIASLDLKQNGQEVRVTVIEEPKIASTPVSPQLRKTVMLTLVGGFVVALGLVTLLDSLDDRFRSMEEMQSRLGLPLLAMVQRLDTPESSGLQALMTHIAPTTVESESFRTLRTSLTLTYPDARQIVVTSAEPGDGKTTTLANLAVCYAQAEKRTLLIDADLRRPGLTGLMDMRGPRGLSEVLRGEIDVAQMAPLHIQASGIKGLDILPSGSRPADPSELLSNPRFSQLLAWAEATYDMILIDSPPILATTDTAIIGCLVDGVIVVVRPAKNRRRLVTRVVERLGLMKIPALGIVVNRTGTGDEQSYYGYHSYEYSNGYGYHDGYGHETMTIPNGVPADGCVPFSADATEDDDEDDEPQAMTVPRRVA